MSKLVEIHCDSCDVEIYHSMFGYKIKGERRWFWRGAMHEPYKVDICGDCFNAIRDVVKAKRESKESL